MSAFSQTKMINESIQTIDPSSSDRELVAPSSFEVQIGMEQLSANNFDELDGDECKSLSKREQEPMGKSMGTLATGFLSTGSENEAECEIEHLDCGAKNEENGEILLCTSKRWFI